MYHLPHAVTVSRLRRPRGGPPALCIKNLERRMDPTWAGAVRGNCGAIQTQNYSYLSSHWCNPPVVWASGAETSIKTWRLSLNLSLALRKKQPRPEFLSFLSQRHTDWVCLQDFVEQEIGLNFVSTWEKIKSLCIFISCQHQTDISAGLGRKLGY